MKRLSHFSKTAVALQVGTRPLQTEIAESHAGHTPIPFLKRTRSYICTPFRMEHSSPSNKQLHGELPLSNSTLKAGRGEAYTLTHMRRSEAHATHAPHLATRSTLEREHERHLRKVYGTKKAETIGAVCSPTLLLLRGRWLHVALLSHQVVMSHTSGTRCGAAAAHVQHAVVRTFGTYRPRG